jgi:hypothetical protein
MESEEYWEIWGNTEGVKLEISAINKVAEIFLFKNRTINFQAF